MKKLLLGSDFMFNEELGSRLRGSGYLVDIFSNQIELQSKLDDNYDLVIIDLENNNLGGLESLIQIVKNGTTVLALTQHKSTELANNAIALGANKVIFNSQASKNIEKYVSEILIVG